jgi:hypothetical protein
MAEWLKAARLKRDSRKLECGFGDRREAERAKPCTAWYTGRNERAHPTPFVVDEKENVGLNVIA